MTSRSRTGVSIRIAAWLTLAVLSAAAAMGALLYFGVIWLHDPDPVRYPVRGIDISHHQGSIDWNALRSHSFSFVFIKATEGGDFVDPRFTENWRNAGAHGFARGAYHFFTLCRPGREQARNFIRTVPREPGTIPPVVDLEFQGNCRQHPSGFIVIDEIRAYIEEVTRHYGVRPILYVTREFYDLHLRNELPGYRIWLRAVYERPTLPDGREWDFWQYNSRGRVAGIAVRVDLNVFRGTREEFSALLSVR